MADIVLKDRNGNPVEYPGVERIEVNTVDGEAVEFVDSATVPGVLEDLPIVLDFSGGNQEIVAPDGFAVKSAIIQKPENLIPENIPEGLNIAGIIGTLAAGGGAKVAIGTVAYSLSNRTVTHNLGVVPDLIICMPQNAINGSTSGTRYLSFLGISRKFYDEYPSCVPGSAVYYYSSKWYTKAYTVPMDEATSSGDNGIYNVSTTQFSTAAYGLEQVWIAIGGLT